MLPLPPVDFALGRSQNAKLRKKPEAFVPTERRMILVKPTDADCPDDTMPNKRPRLEPKGPQRYKRWSKT